METKKTTADYRYILHKETGKKLHLPYGGWDSKVDVETGKTISIRDRKYKESNLPTFNDLKAQGAIEEVDELEIGEIRGVFDAKTAQSMAKEMFGIDISIEAFEHNIRAHKADYKSGFVAGDFFIFSPCGCNDLYFNITRYVGLDWQETYFA